MFIKVQLIRYKLKRINLSFGTLQEWLPNTAFRSRCVLLVLRKKKTKKKQFILKYIIGKKII